MEAPPATKTTLPENEALHLPLKDSDIGTLSESRLIRAREKGIYINNSGRKLVRISEGTVLKSGRDVFASEAANMKFVAANTTIKVPCVHQVLTVSDKKSIYGATSYIVRDYIQGTCLSECWSELEEDVQQEVCRQVMDAIYQLQSLKLDRPGPVDGGMAHGSWFTDFGAGPFSSQADLEGWFNHKLDVCKRLTQARKDAPSFTGKFAPLVMSHMDISPRNLILDKYQQVWFIDWECAGAYPVFFERASLLLEPHHLDFKEEILGRMEEHLEDIRHLCQTWFAISSAFLM
eukprot:Plantae.Rhodophyta-Hildenbrandia_rubra.ctg2758.p1 GENE.Plantae.Rhodophyta-Hildenbrandia_rubra.ctg2758~~Plantae.Rhodophyta-Hildenbrandia_rubra.ctg2758.p1  ORF type:complete len:290 (-),score=20.79 Plantae.Rhodophyta-Hildenbrandia_rubra.ctg2758:241-1110(-)